MAGDVSIKDLEQLALNYLGTVPKRKTERTVPIEAVQVNTLGRWELVKYNRDGGNIAREGQREVVFKETNKQRKKQRNKETKKQAKEGWEWIWMEGAKMGMGEDGLNKEYLDVRSSAWSRSLYRGIDSAFM